MIAEIIRADVDVIALQGFDYDLHGTALAAFADILKARGAPYPYQFAAPPNAGRASGLDLDGDGRLGGPGDSQGWGRFFGQGSMALLSRHPIAVADVTDFSGLLWRDLPGALLPSVDGKPFPSHEAQDAQLLSSHGHWVVPVDHPTLGRINLMTYHATPPVFDGPEDRNGRRNHDETAFWLQFLEGTFGPAPAERFVILGDANLDPDRGDGRRDAMRRLLDHPRLQDPLPDQPTVAWEQTGPMRVDYVLPSADWRVLRAKVAPRNPQASRHALVWVELSR